MIDLELIKGGTFNNILGYAMGGQVKRNDLYYYIQVVHWINIYYLVNSIVELC